MLHLWRHRERQEVLAWGEERYRSLCQHLPCSRGILTRPPLIMHTQSLLKSQDAASAATLRKDAKVAVPRLLVPAWLMTTCLQALILPRTLKLHYSPRFPCTRAHCLTTRTRAGSMKLQCSMRHHNLASEDEKFASRQILTPQQAQHHACAAASLPAMQDSPAAMQMRNPIRRKPGRPRKHPRTENFSKQGALVEIGRFL